MTERLLAKGDVGNKTNILVCDGCTKCDGDVLMVKVIDYLGTFLTFDFDTSARVSYDNKTYILVSLLKEDSSLFEHELSTYVDNEELYFCLKYCGIQQWNEGVLICEREIAKRELNKGSVVVERFEL